MQPLPLDERLDRIGQHIVRARLFFDLWFYFEEQDSKRKIIETMREYNEFFRFTPHLRHQYFTTLPREAAEAMMKTLTDGAS